MPTISIQQNPPLGASSQSNSFEESDYPDEPFSSEEHEWGDDEDDVAPSDSASASNEGTHYYPRGPPRRNHRVVPVHHWRGQHPAAPAQVPHPPPSVDSEQDYRAHWGRGYPGQTQQHHQHQAPYNAAGGRPYPGPSAPYNMGAYANNGMVPFGQQYHGHHLSHQGHNGVGMYGGEGHGYDMMPYGYGYYGDPRQFAMPASIQQYQMPGPVASPSEHPGQSVTPAKDEEKLRLEAELAALKAQEEKTRAAEKQREMEAKIRRDAELAFERRMEDMRIAQERAQKEIERAKAEAERAARERMEAEKKAEEERAKQHAEAMRRAEENARMKFEADQKAAEERRRREEEERRRAEEAAHIRLQAAIKAEADAKALADQKAAEEAARIKQIEEDAKRKAEADAAAKIEKERADAAAQAEAEAASKKQQELLKAKWQEEAREKLEEAAKKKADKQAPIRFKDAVGRKFSFPFHLCKTWAGMEDLIKQAFLQVDVLGPHVQEGHYDLIGPDGETILPSVWEKIIQPDWSITMTMWPMDKTPLLGTGRSRGRGAMPPPPPLGRHGIPVSVPNARRNGVPAGVDIINTAPSKSKSSKKKEDNLFKFFAGGQSKPKKKSKK